MTKFLLALHVLAAIVAIGPVTVAASMFPAAVRGVRTAEGQGPATARTLHGICRVYALVAVAVPLFGFATASALHVLGSPWLIASIILTTVAAVVLGVLVLPLQHELLSVSSTPDDEPLPRSATARLAMLTGVFNLLWAAVTVLMIVRPGSTTGA
ncbi:DUF2269 family protein [Actinacidiphila acidipaludis]|uniref:DUF2269 family protein n=1 Tax=Actinacidiphila acidipaludis TaxID=2873382 RepID=A0ABS7QHI4_9ACTN|nr:hypothetical protein [Streptomyces acidipaludis]MBY8882139.1 hypothetical protein [Streptomyces acidipaludis]